MLHRPVEFAPLAVVRSGFLYPTQFGHELTLQQCFVALLYGQGVGKRLPPLT